MEFLLKAKPQSVIVDADDAADLNAGDAVSLVVQMIEAREQEVVKGSKPVGQI